MKKLNVNWLPETFAMISLTVSAAPSAETCRAASKECDTNFYPDAPGKLIIISRSNELRANVATLH